MKPFHRACGSSKVVRHTIVVDKQTIPVMYCLHCRRILESYDIEHPHPIVVSKVTNAHINTPELHDDLAKHMVITERKWR